MTVRRSAPEMREGAGPVGAWHPHLGPLAGLAFATPMLLILVGFVVYPIGRLLGQASSDGAGLERYREVFTDNVSLRALTTTISDSLVVSVICVSVGGLFAWTLHATRQRWLRVLVWIALLIPFTMGTIVKNYSIMLILAANGPLNSLMQMLGLTDEPVRMLYTPGAVVFGISYSLLPYAGLTLYSVFSHVDLGLIASARSLGATRQRANLTVALPLVRGGMIVTAALIFVLSLGFYVTPVLLGGLQSPFLATVINQQIFTLYDFPGASATAVVVLLVALLAMVLAFLLAGRSALKEVL